MARLVEVETKPRHRSRTYWVNGISILVAILSLFVEPQVLVNLGVPAAVAEVYRGWLVIALAVANIILRELTGAPIEGSPPARQARSVVRVKAGDL